MSSPEVRHGSAGPALASVGALAGLVLVCTLDWLTGPGSAAALLYVPLVLAARPTARPRVVLSVAGVGIVLTAVVGALSLSPADASGYTTGYVVWNRIVTIVAIGACGWLDVRMLRSQHHLASARLSLVSARRRESDQQELGQVASESGQFRAWSIDIANGEMTWSDQPGVGQTGQTGQTPSIEEAMSFYLPEDQARIASVLALCVAEGLPFDEELRLARPDGDRVWVNAIGAAELGPEREVVRVFGTFGDITRRRAAELSAEQSRHRLRAMTDAMPLLVWTAGADGELDSFSRGLSEYTGATAAQVLGSSWQGLVHPEDLERCVQRWSRSVRTHEPYLVEFRIRRHDGAYRWHLTQASPELGSDGQVIAWWGSSTDVDDLRRTQEELRMSAARLGNTLESIGDAVLALDPQWRVMLMNSHAESLLQRKRADLVGKVVWDEFPEAEGMMFRSEYDRAIAENRPVRFEAEYPPVGLWLEISAYPHDEGLTIYFRDVTEQRSLAEQLAHAQRLKSLGQLTGGVAHDFNNLLTVIMGTSEVLMADLADQPTQRVLAETILDVAQRGGELTHRLLAFAGNQPLNPSNTDLNALVRSNQPLLSRTLGDRIDVVSRLHPGLHRCVVDGGQLENALLNLCLNARDAMAAGGRLIVETENVVLDHAYAARHAEVEAGDYVMLAVSDQGVGIAASDLDRVFEPFFTTKPVGEGSGLGLAMVYGFVRQSLGHIRVYSELGHGTTVRIYLPAATTDAGGTGHPAGPERGDLAAAPRSDPGGQERVLVVEDDDLIRLTVHDQLSSLGYHVTDAADGPAALEMLAGGLGVDLLLTDVVMPRGMTGAQLAGRVREMLPDLPVLYTSGYTRGGVPVNGPDDLEVRLLSKPYGLGELALYVREAIEAPARHRDPS